MNISALYIEDDPTHRDDFLREAANVDGLMVEYVAPDYMAASDWLVGRKHIDIIFSDIELPRISGLQIAKALANKCFMFVFVSAHETYKVEAWGVKPAGYLMKPVMQDELAEFVEKLRRIKRAGQDPTEFFHDVDRNEYVQVMLKEVTELRTGADSKNHTRILLGADMIVVNRSLVQVLKDLEGYGLFIRIRGDLAVSIGRILGVKDWMVRMEDGSVYNVTASYQDALRAVMKHTWS